MIRDILEQGALASEPQRSDAAKAHWHGASEALHMVTFGAVDLVMPTVSPFNGYKGRQRQHLRPLTTSSDAATCQSSQQNSGYESGYVPTATKVSKVKKKGPALTEGF